MRNISMRNISSLVNTDVEISSKADSRLTIVGRIISREEEKSIIFLGMLVILVGVSCLS